MQHGKEQHGDRLGEVDELPHGRVGEDLSWLLHRRLDDRDVARVLEQCPGVRAYHGIVVDADYPGA